MHIVGCSRLLTDLFLHRAIPLAGVGGRTFCNFSWFSTLDLREEAVTRKKVFLEKVSLSHSN